VCRGVCCSVIMCVLRRVLQCDHVCVAACVAV